MTKYQKSEYITWKSVCENGGVAARKNRNTKNWVRNNFSKVQNLEKIKIYTSLKNIGENEQKSQKSRKITKISKNWVRDVKEHIRLWGGSQKDKAKYKKLREKQFDKDAKSEKVSKIYKYKK